jgi:hypothetical protein
MTNAMRLVVLTAAVGALVGCGGAKIGSKEEAAKWAGQSGDSLGSSKGALLSLYKSGVDSSGSISVSCTHGGTAEAKFAGTGTDASGFLTYELTYKNCTEPSYDDPETEAIEKEDVVANGTLTFSMKIDITSTTAAFEIKMKGRVDLGGAYSDFLEMDITESYVANVTDTSIDAKFVINGSIKTSSETYSYNNETYTLSVDGKIEKQG